MNGGTLSSGSALLPRAKNNARIFVAAMRSLGRLDPDALNAKVMDFDGVRPDHLNLNHGRTGELVRN